jgi:hypothetical protein
LLVGLISRGLGHRRGLRDLRGRAARADIAQALSILANAPDIPAEDPRTTNARPVTKNPFDSLAAAA